MANGGRLTVGCRNEIRIARVEKDDAPTSCKQPSGCQGSMPRTLGALSGVGAAGLTGCTRLTETTHVTVKSVTCNDVPCEGWTASSVGPGISLEPTSIGPLRIRVVADFDGTEVEDTTTLQVDPGPCLAPVLPIDAGRPPFRDAGGACEGAFSTPVQIAGLEDFPAAHPSLGEIPNGGNETALLFDTPDDGGGTRVLRAQRAARTFPSSSSRIAATPAPRSSSRSRTAARRRSTAPARRAKRDSRSSSRTRFGSARAATATGRSTRRRWKEPRSPRSRTSSSWEAPRSMAIPWSRTIG